MKRIRPTSQLVVLVGVVTLMSALVLSACGASSALRGNTKLGTIQTGSETMTQVQSATASAPFTLKAQSKNLLILYMGYTNCPDLCPTTLSDLRTARQSIGAKSASMVSVAFATVDPGNDSPQVMLDYTKRFGFGPTDHVLRPSADELIAVQKTVYAASAAEKPTNSNANTVDHTAYTYVIDSTGRVVDEWDFGTPAKDMAHDMKTLLKTVP